ncbi:MAG: hypothetical protein O8C66_03590 [Candidatus Methanoperedens sp.]|nr:hypothetical protein [Candidatus Methanoperedens sp.]MCZ7369569.1 hypothetical protein [Candidatus Methanoperedens sp.]
MSHFSKSRREEIQGDGIGRRDRGSEDTETSNTIFINNARFLKTDSSRYNAWQTASVIPVSSWDIGILSTGYSALAVSYRAKTRSGAAKVMVPSNYVQPSNEVFFTNTNNNACANGNAIFNDFAKITKNIRILGLMAIISYMTVILFTWIYANINGYVYFSAGEPILSIKYPEWLLGFVGILVAIDCLRKELNDLIYLNK